MRQGPILAWYNDRFLEQLRHSPYHDWYRALGSFDPCDGLTVLVVESLGHHVVGDVVVGDLRELFVHVDVVDLVRNTRSRHLIWVYHFKGMIGGKRVEIVFQILFKIN